MNTIIPHHLLTNGLPVRTDRPVFLNRLYFVGLPSLENEPQISDLVAQYKRVLVLNPFKHNKQPQVAGLDPKPIPYPTYNKIGILVNGLNLSRADNTQPIRLEVWAFLLIAQATTLPPERYVLEDNISLGLPIGNTSVLLNTISPPTTLEHSLFVTYNLLGYSELEFKTAIPESGYESVVLYAKLENVATPIANDAGLFIHLTGY